MECSTASMSSGCTARQRDELLLVSAAEDAQAGLVDVDHRLVAIGMVDEKAAWHMSENVADVELG